MIDGLGKGAIPRLPTIDADNGQLGGLRGTPRGTAAAEAGKAVAGTSARPAAVTGKALVRDMAASPPVNSAKVEALRNAIAAGTYKADPDAIAAKMIVLERGSGGV
jgi:negative regulator of flagellin synthesis FlgM